MQAPVGWIDAYHCTSYAWTTGRGRHRCFITKERHADMACPVRRRSRYHIKFHGCRVWREAQQWTFRRRKFVVIGQYKRWRWSALWAILLIGDRVVPDKIGPAVPCSLTHLE